MNNHAEILLRRIKNDNPMTGELTLEEFLEGMKTRFSKVFGEVLNIVDYDITVIQLREKGLIPEHLDVSINS